MEISELLKRFFEGSGREHGAPRPDIFDPGQVLADNYEVRAVLGTGGMGQVFEAFDRSLRRRVAIKAAWPEAQTQLASEAQALAAFRHGSLPTVHCISKHDETSFIVMERVCGVTLGDHLRRLLENGDVMPVTEATELLASIAEALAIIHDAGLAHLDVKPDNIMLTPDRRIVMLDFGLATPEFELLRLATSAGTPAYMAPELVSRDIDVRSGHLADIYSLGVTAFELLTGQRPRPVQSFDDLKKISPNATIDTGSCRDDLPRAIANLIDEMLAVHPGERPQSADAIRWQLRKHGELHSGDATVSMLLVEDDIHVAKTLGFYARKF